MRNKSVYLLFVGLTIASGLASCVKDHTVDNPDNTVKFEDLKVSDFNFETTTEHSFTISAQDNLNNAVAKVRFDIYTALPDSGGVILASGATNNEGIFSGKVKVPSDLETVCIKTSYIGFPSDLMVDIVDNSIIATYGGKQKSLNVNTSKGGFKSGVKNSAGVPLAYLGTFNSQGVPNYLMPQNDPISQSFLNDVNASLPEYRPVPTYNPEYLDAGNQTTLSLVQESDVWVTFVHEGAGYRNVLGFYTYDANNPPATVNNISAITIIFPNVSFVGSGGGLVSGNKVHLGTFPPNTKIGWAVLQNAFNGTINPNATTFYSDKWLNPEVNPNLKQHTVQLLDPGRDIVLLSFEDLRRDGSCDNDFNDAIFYVTANPVEAIQYTPMPLITYINPDSDGDGIPNNFDEFPTDPAKAFISYYPGSTTYGTLGFEDLWPGKGDYDFNDLVVKYRFQIITNGNNEVVQLKPTFIPEAMGASLNSGFGFQLPMTPSGAIQSVTGSMLTQNYINLSANGAEAGQSKATFIAFDKALATFQSFSGQNPQGMSGINTVPGGMTGVPDTIRMVINFVNPLNAAAIGQAPYNPFIFVDYDRGHEIHLPDFPPTDLMNNSYFGTFNDDSNPTTGRYYKTINNLPWAMNIIDPFDYTVEKNQISQAYTYFNSWATSSGYSNKDWYKSFNGYRVTSKIFIQNY